MNNNKNSTRYFSSQQESYIAKKFGGKLVPNSGAGRFNKSDVVFPLASMSIECKTTTKEKNSFSVKKDWLKKQKEESFENRYSNSALAISFSPNGDENYFVINEKLFKYLLDKLERDESECMV